MSEEINLKKTRAKMARLRPTGARRGFTFVEVLVVIALSAVIGTALLSSYMMGMRVWKRTANPDFSRRKDFQNGKKKDG